MGSLHRGLELLLGDREYARRDRPVAECSWCAVDLRRHCRIGDIRLVVVAGMVCDSAHSAGRGIDGRYIVGRRYRHWHDHGRNWRAVRVAARPAATREPEGWHDAIWLRSEGIPVPLFGTVAAGL